MSVYYLKGRSNYGDSAGISGYYYPLYTSTDSIVGPYHQHTFEGLSGVVFYMPMGFMNHGTSGPPSAAAYNNETYSEYATYNYDSDSDSISYTNVPESSLIVSSVAQYSLNQAEPHNERISNKESPAVEDLIPDQLRESAETLTSLLEDYYTYLNSNNQVLNVSKRILTEHDIDQTSADYLNKIQQEIAISVPESRVIDTVLLYKRIVNYYSIRGSEESVLVFFKLFFDEIVDVLYPKDFLLKASSGDWVSEDNILNYKDTLSGFSDNTSLNKNSLGESIKFYDTDDNEIAVGQITRLEEVDIPNIVHPDKDLLFLEIDAAEKDRYDIENNTFRVYDGHNKTFSQSVAKLKNGVTFAEEEGFSFTDSPGGGSFDRNHIDLGEIYNTNPEILTQAINKNAHTLVAYIKLNGGSNGPVHLFSDTVNYPALQIGISDNKLSYETWRWGTGNGYNSVQQTGTTTIPDNQYATLAVRGKRDYAGTADGNTGQLRFIDNVRLNDAMRTAGTYTGLSSTSGGGGTGATFDVVIHQTAIGSISNQNDPTGIARVPGTYTVTDTSVTYINGDGLHTKVNLTVVVDAIGEATITINSGGSGFTVGDIVTLSGVQEVAGITFEVASLTSNVSSVTLSSAGSGYSLGDTITILETDFGRVVPSSGKEAIIVSGLAISELGTDMNGVYTGNISTSNNFGSTGYNQVSPANGCVIEREDLPTGTEDNPTRIDYRWNIMDAAAQTTTPAAATDWLQRSDNNPTIRPPYYSGFTSSRPFTITKQKTGTNNLRVDVKTISAFDTEDAAAGNGHIEVSVNGETWDRVWDDSDYGTPTSFDIKSAVVHYAPEDGGHITTQVDINGFTKAGTSSNGSDYYETDIANTVITGNSTNSSVNAFNNTILSVDKYVIEYMTAEEIYTFYYQRSVNAVMSDILSAFDYNPDGQVAYGMWMLVGELGGTKRRGLPLQLWVDAKPNAAFEVINNRSSGIMHKISQYPASVYENYTTGAFGGSRLPNDIYDGTAQVVTGNGNNSLNDSGVQRTSFYQTLIDYEKRMKVLPGFGTTTSTSLKRHTYSPLQLLYSSSSASTRFVAADPQLPQISSSNWVTHGKKITAVTTKEMLDVNDIDATLRLGVRRSNEYFQGNIKYFAYYQKQITPTKIAEIHRYLDKRLNPYQWAMRVAVEENKSLSSLEYLRNEKLTYTFSNITGKLKDSFWTYESSENNALSNFSVMYNQTNGKGQLSFGDGSSSLDIISRRKYVHTFNKPTFLSGSYNNRKGFLSDINKLQDSNFWQDYSYQIRAGVQLNDWESEYLRLVHPAGMKMFSALLMQISRSNSWLGDPSYKINKDIQGNSQIGTDNLRLTDFLQKLVPPWKTLADDERRTNAADANAMHMPFYQPGWLDAEFRSLFILIHVLVHGDNPRTGSGIYERAAYLLLRLIAGPNAEARNEKVFNEYKRWTKWFDKHTLVSDYANLTANELNSNDQIILPSQRKETNLLNEFLPWSPGRGNDTKYGTTNGKVWRRSGAILENFREYVVTPFKDTTIGWIGVNADSGGNSEGGFASPNVLVDITKTYRFSTWIRQSKIRTNEAIIAQFGDNNTTNRQQYAGTGFFGINTYTSATSITGTAGTKGYWSTAVARANNAFLSSFSCPTADEWYLLVGFVRPDLGNNTRIHSNDFGLYNTSGEKVGYYDLSGSFVSVSTYETGSPINNWEFKWATDVSTTHVSLTNYMLYDQTIDKNPAYWWGPRIEVVDGSEPSIQELFVPTIEPNVFYNIDDRPANRKVKKFSNISTNAIYPQQSELHTITTNDYDYRARNNYNENLKFFDNSKIGPYYDTPISDMVTVTEEGYISNDDTYMSAGDYSSSNEYTPPSNNNNSGQGGY